MVLENITLLLIPRRSEWDDEDGCDTLDVSTQPIIVKIDLQWIWKGNLISNLERSDIHASDDVLVEFSMTKVKIVRR